MELKDTTLESKYEPFYETYSGRHSSINTMDESINKLTNDIQRKKNDVLIKRLKELTGVDLDVDREAARRFKQLAVEYSGNEERIYFNDGSEQGMRIVTFVQNDHPFSYDEDTFSIKSSCSYY